MNSNQESNQFGQGSKIDKRQEENPNRHSETNRNIKQNYIDNSDANQVDFGGIKKTTFPVPVELEASAEDEDRYNYGASEHDDLIETTEEESKVRYSSPTRNGSHRNHF